MPDKILQSLDGVSETLLIPLHVRAMETQRPNAMITDYQAVEIVNKLECDFSRLRIQRHDEVAIIMRMNKFDQLVREYLLRIPQAVVVHIGCGLDTRFDRVDNGLVEWFDLDLPEVIRLREKLLQNENKRYHQIACSIFDDGWQDSVDQFRPSSVMFIAEGVLPYFAEAQVKGLFLNLSKTYPGSELVCDVHSPFMILADNIHLLLTKVKARMHWGVQNAADLEAWGNGICLLESWNYFEDEDSPLRNFGYLRLFPQIRNATCINRYHLG